MKFKIYILLFLILFLISGCTSEYNLFISDDEILENIHIEFLENESLPFSTDNPIYVFHNNFDVAYEKKVKNKGDLKIIDYDYSYKLEDFVNANSFNQCFDYRNVIVNDDDYFEFEIANYNGCVLKNNFDIKIKTDNKVLENNADDVKNNVYIWHVDTNNPDKFSLKIKIAKGVSASKLNIQDNEIILLFICAFILILFTVGLIFKIKLKKRNDF